MSVFSFICNIVGLISNICILFLTVYTLYLTAFSRKMDFVSMGSPGSAFFGDTLHFHIRNRSLHSIPITSVFLMKKIGGMFHRIRIAEYNDQPFVIDAWHIGKIETEPFTHIIGIDEKEEDTPDKNKSDSGDYEEPSLSNIHMDAVIGVETGNKVIWIKPYKKAPLNAAKKAYRKHNYDILTVTRKNYNNKVISRAVNYVINLIATELNGQKAIKTVFAIAGSQSALLSDTICGYNAIEGNIGSSEEEFKKCLCDQFGIDKENISVEKKDRTPLLRDQHERTE